MIQRVVFNILDIQFVYVNTEYEVLMYTQLFWDMVHVNRYIVTDVSKEIPASIVRAF